MGEVEDVAWAGDAVRLGSLGEAGTLATLDLADLLRRQGTNGSSGIEAGGVGGGGRWSDGMPVVVPGGRAAVLGKGAPRAGDDEVNHGQGEQDQDTAHGIATPARSNLTASGG